eukprot:TRINITY_DN967_c0_g7_i1.p1 TRINITY_DN967_c0_g7~~TRINITY_DN967_c0_g7_i1.p1  ORF type:complete len:310 (-),score=91.48 TRINITY_DN967_c0_g7_i1:158-1087(-)
MCIRDSNTNDGNAYTHLFELLLGFSEELHTGVKLPDFPKCVEAIVALNTRVFRSAQIIYENGLPALGKSIFELGSGLEFMQNITTECIDFVDETLTALEHAASNYSSNAGQFALNGLFRARQIYDAFAEISPAITYNNSYEIGTVLADFLNTIFELHPRLAEAQQKYEQSSKQNITAATAFIQCIGNLDKTYKAFNMTWSDYLQNSKIWDLIDDVIIIVYDIPMTWRNCKTALSGGKKKKEAKKEDPFNDDDWGSESKRDDIVLLARDIRMMNENLRGIVGESDGFVESRLKSVKVHQHRKDTLFRQLE